MHGLLCNGSFWPGRVKSREHRVYGCIACAARLPNAMKMTWFVYV